MKDKKSKVRGPKGTPNAIIGGNGDRFEGLSEEERGKMLAMRGSGVSANAPPQPTMSVDDPGALKKQNESLVQERDRLKGDLDKAKKDLDGANSDLKEVREKLKTANQNLETNRRINNELNDELEKKKNRIKDLTDDVNSLKEEVGRLQSGRPDAHELYNEKTFSELNRQIKDLKGEKSRLEENIATLTEDVGKATGERDGFKAEAEGLERELNDLRKEIEVERTTISVDRDDERTLSSSRFEDGNYDVRLGADLSYITFRKDPNGKALCWKGKISLPKLKAYVPFEKKTKYAGEEIDGMIRISLI